MLILDDTRPISLAAITKQNVNSLLERERHGKRDGWRREETRGEEKERRNHDKKAPFVTQM